jgi:hypothetical protein
MQVLLPSGLRHIFACMLRGLLLSSCQCKPNIVFQRPVSAKHRLRFLLQLSRRQRFALEFSRVLLPNSTAHRVHDTHTGAHLFSHSRTELPHVRCGGAGRSGRRTYLYCAVDEHNLVVRRGIPCRAQLGRDTASFRTGVHLRHGGWTCGGGQNYRAVKALPVLAEIVAPNPAAGCVRRPSSHFRNSGARQRHAVRVPVFAADRVVDVER